MTPAASPATRHWALSLRDIIALNRPRLEERLLVVLVSYRDYKTGNAWPSIAKLAGDVRSNAHDVSEALDSLAADGVISRAIRGDKQLTVYRFNEPRSEAPSRNGHAPEPEPTAPGDLPF